jgi:hypothetical protein
MRKTSLEEARCNEPCGYGGTCACNPSVKHQWHICNSEHCYCHTRERYHPKHAELSKPFVVKISEELWP